MHTLPSPTPVPIPGWSRMQAAGSRGSDAVRLAKTGNLLLKSDSHQSTEVRGLFLVNVPAASPGLSQSSRQLSKAELLTGAAVRAPHVSVSLCLSAGHGWLTRLQSPLPPALSTNDPFLGPRNTSMAVSIPKDGMCRPGTMYTEGA